MNHSPMTTASALHAAPTRGATAPDAPAARHAASLRRCIVTGDERPKAEMIRFVVWPDQAGGPGGTIVPDIDGRLQARGLWLTATRDIVATAVAKRRFAKAAHASIEAPADLAGRVERLLAARMIGLLGLARRAGAAVTGFENVRRELLAGRAGLLVVARDCGAEGRRKLGALGRDLPLVEVLTAGELGEAFGRPDAVHVAVATGPFALNLAREAGRLRGFRAPRELAVK